MFWPKIGFYYIYLHSIGWSKSHDPQLSEHPGNTVIYRPWEERRAGSYEHCSTVSVCLTYKCHLLSVNVQVGCLIFIGPIRKSRTSSFVSVQGLSGRGFPRVLWTSLEPSFLWSGPVVFHLGPKAPQEGPPKLPTKGNLTKIQIIERH